ncbi:transmembrane protein 150A-like isoform X1 [Hemibagrus wyckioides]|uniref:transmembrane protein 150A-like isoform X1 n=1 Tax=Hemibagrus wyckioides TaxID=337641 RepID=UPI00266BB7D4|nr:transmembrane protein 150A-like isoform X1 [Hemibagrus wyckioides]
MVMSGWMILPISLPVLTITGIWVVGSLWTGLSLTLLHQQERRFKYYHSAGERYAMALYNQHVCPVDNWLYNQSCEEDLPMQTGPTLCCTLDNVPLISKCGTLPPESCFFSLICSTGSFMVMVIVLLHYAHVIEKRQNCVLNTASLSTGWICSAGLIMVGNFQVDNAKVLHYVGAGVAFPTSVLFVSVQSALTYKLAKTQGEYNMGHLRLIMTLLAFVALVLSGVFFVQESFVLQHASAIFEWVFCVIIMLFYGTFAFEFASISSNTMMVLARGGALSSNSQDHKMESLSGTSQHQPENMSML